MRHIVITSIYPPSKAIEGFASLEGCNIVVAGDLKSPQDWKHPNCTFLSAKEQKQLPFRIVKKLPWNHYCRKMLGYLHAIQNGATEIMDTDDDNIPYSGLDFPQTRGTFAITKPNLGFVNVYHRYTTEPIWPRGLPLNLIAAPREAFEPANLSEEPVDVGIWQGLADLDPDVDAIYRFTSNKTVTFNKAPPVVLAERSWCPFNSQNTLYTRRELFPLLYLPAFVTFRFTDILRGYVAQPILQAAGYRLGFIEATVYQERNEHNLLHDFKDEIPFYLNATRCMEIIEDSVQKGKSIQDNLREVYHALIKKEIVPNQEMPLLETWLQDVSQL
jgi:hypothetical protein